MIIKKLILFISFAYLSILQAATIGTSNLQGNLSVNSGILNYSVPFVLPIGEAGMQLELSLNYNSNTGNGYFGEGWSLSGMSVIHRCGSTLEYDGKVQGVTYTTEDNLCMNGQRLELISGTKWGSNSIYKTHIDTYQKILFDGKNFTVWTKDNLEKKYELKNDFWYLTKVSDRFKNSIQYNYFESEQEIYLKSIIYADNEINFNYEDRKNICSSYKNGKIYKVSKQVQSIDILSNNAILRQYTLLYNEIQTLQLVSIEETSHGDKLEPVIFEYDNKDLRFNRSSIGPNISSPMSNLKYGDFNGDGFLDIYEVVTGDDKVWINDGQGNFINEYSVPNITADTKNIVLVDYDSDGYPDIYTKNKLVEGNFTHKIFFNDKYDSENSF